MDRRVACEHRRVFRHGHGRLRDTDEGYATLYRDGSDRIKPFTVLTAMNNAAGSWIGLEHGLTGPNLTYSTACSSSAVAVGEAWLRVRSGAAPLALAGGAEAPLTLGTLKAWEALKTLATEDQDDAAASCKPFARDRSGLVLGEGAAVVVLEEWQHARRRNAEIFGEIVGYGLATDTAHITRPSVEGQARALELALASARVAPREVGYINAHGTGTAANDAVETGAIKRVFGAPREEGSGELDEIDARPLARRGRRRGAHRDVARAAHAHVAADAEPARAGSRMRSRLRPERRARGAGRRARAHELVRIRRHECRARLQEGVIGAWCASETCTRLDEDAETPDLSALVGNTTKVGTSRVMKM